MNFDRFKIMVVLQVLILVLTIFLFFYTLNMEYMLMNAGETQPITWADNITGDVNIDLYKGGVFNSVIVASEPSDGLKTWSIPAGQETGTDYTIMIASIDIRNIVDFCRICSFYM